MDLDFKKFSLFLLNVNCKDWNYIGPKTGLGSNANGPNNKFVERGQKNWIYPRRKMIRFNVSRRFYTSISSEIYLRHILSSLFHMVFFKIKLYKSFPSPLSVHFSTLYTAVLVSSLPHTCRLDSRDSSLSHPTLPRTIIQ